MGTCGPRASYRSCLDQWCVAWSDTECMVPQCGSHHVGHRHVCILIVRPASVHGNAARLLWPSQAQAKLLEHENGVASRSLYSERKAGRHNKHRANYSLALSHSYPYLGCDEYYQDKVDAGKRNLKLFCRAITPTASTTSAGPVTR